MDIGVFMDIMIVGYGFVGRAHEAVLKERNTIHIYDPALGYNDWWKKPDGVIICVSTPAAKDGSCDVSNVQDTLSYIDPDTPVLIKSTISLEGWRQLKFMFPNHQLAFSPEFLRAATAIEDMESSTEMFIGGESIVFWHALFRLARNNNDWNSVICDPEELILAKYFRNSFLATKVAFFNQVYDLCEAAGVNYNAVRQAIVNDKRIGDSHTLIAPERGYGGHCFPKDVSAIIETAERFETELSIIQEAKNYNQDIRSWAENVRKL